MEKRIERCPVHHAVRPEVKKTVAFDVG